MIPFVDLVVVLNMNDKNRQQDTRQDCEEGVASTISKARVRTAGDQDCQLWVAIKTAPCRRRFSPEPHDIVKEIAIISQISNANVRCLILCYIHLLHNLSVCRSLNASVQDITIRTRRLRCGHRGCPLTLKIYLTRRVSYLPSTPMRSNTYCIPFMGMFRTEQICSALWHDR